MQISHTHFLIHNSQKIRKQPLEGVRKNMYCGFCSEKIAKYPCRSSIFSKVAGCSPTTLLKMNYITGIFQVF